MGLLRLMGNKADVVKGLSKRCNENWSVAPKSDIVRPRSLLCTSLSSSLRYALTLDDRRAYRVFTCPTSRTTSRRARRT